jgi:hypothetical protein
MIDGGDIDDDDGRRTRSSFCSFLSVSCFFSSLLPR